MAIAALIIGALMVLVGMFASLTLLRRSPEAAQGSNAFSASMVLIGLGCVIAMLSLLVVW